MCIMDPQHGCPLLRPNRICSIKSKTKLYLSPRHLPVYRPINTSSCQITLCHRKQRASLLRIIWSEKGFSWSKGVHKSNCCQTWTTYKLVWQKKHTHSDMEQKLSIIDIITTVQQLHLVVTDDKTKKSLRQAMWWWSLIKIMYTQTIEQQLLLSKLVFLSVRQQK